MFVSMSAFFKRAEPKKKTYNRFRDKYKVVYAKNGNKEFVKVGTTDMYALAQSHKDAVSIDNIIKRATNDASVLNRTVGQYADITKVPTNMFDAKKVIEDAKKTYEGMSATQKAAYNNSFDNFLGTFKTATGLAKYLTVIAPKKQPAKEAAPDKKEVTE